jgi:hypothetical protein
MAPTREAERTSDRTGWTPAAALGHPLFAIALVVLVVNDHVLKGADALPAIVTGKLSDIAGAIVAPVVLAWLTGTRTWRGWALAHLAVGAVLIATELAPSFAAAIDALTPWPARLWPDPTDIAAIVPACLLSLLVLGPRRNARHTPSRAATLTVGLFALVACAATSRSTPPPRYPFRPGGVIEADVVLRHTGTEELVARVMRVRDGAELDCDRLLAGDPTLSVPFDHDTSWTLARGDGVPLWNRLAEAPTRECYAVRLEVQGRAWVLAWRHGTPPLASRELRLEPDEPAEADAVVVDADEELPRVPTGVSVRRL